MISSTYRTNSQASAWVALAALFALAAALAWWHRFHTVEGALSAASAEVVRLKAGGLVSSEANPADEAAVNWLKALPAADRRNEFASLLLQDARLNQVTVHEISLGAVQSANKSLALAVPLSVKLSGTYANIKQLIATVHQHAPNSGIDGMTMQRVQGAEQVETVIKWVIYFK